MSLTCVTTIGVIDFISFIPVSAPQMPSVTNPPQIVSPLKAAYHGAIAVKPAEPKKKCRYSDEEKEVLNKYRDEYRKKTTTDERHNLLRSHILVDIFNFWYKEGKVTTEIGEVKFSQRIKVRKTVLIY